jgi:cytochrome P450
VTELPPGPRLPSPVVTAQFLRRPLETLQRWHARYGDVFTVNYLGFGKGVYVADPGAIRDLFTGDQSDLLAGEANSILDPVVGKHSVLVLDGPEHLRQRKLLLPPFQGSRVAGFRSVVREVAEREVDRWRPGAELVMRERMRALTFEVICRAVFGVTEPARVERMRVAFSAVLDTTPLTMASPLLGADLGPLSPGGRLARRLRVADPLLYEEIARRRGESDLAERTDVLSLLLQARDDEGRAMTDAELRDELFTMLGAGHETTATGLAFAVELLMRNPDTFERLRESAAAGDDSYAAAVGKETLRMRPVIDAAQRTLTKPRTVCGWELPPGIKVFPGIALVHHRPDLYPEPHAFRPERFLDGDTESYSWLPFGGGIRRCIGAALAQTEMTEVLGVIAERVDLEPLRDEPDPVVMRGITLAPKHGVPVRVRAVRPGYDGAAVARAASSGSKSGASTPATR